MAFEQTKTVAGSDVVIYERHVGPDQKTLGAYSDGEGDWHMATWDLEGRYNPERRVAIDLVESVPTSNNPEVA